MILTPIPPFRSQLAILSQKTTLAIQKQNQRSAQKLSLINSKFTNLLLRKNCYSSSSKLSSSLFWEKTSFLGHLWNWSIVNNFSSDSHANPPFSGVNWQFCPERQHWLYRNKISILRENSVLINSKITSLFLRKKLLFFFLKIVLIITLSDLIFV